MPIDGRELIEAISVLADEQNVRVTVKQSGKGAIVCGACCFAGGLLLGPAGLAIGGAAGGVVAYKMTKGSFRPLGDVIINDLTDTQKEQLVQHVTKAVQDVHPTDLVMLLPLIMNNLSIQQAVLKTVVSFVSNELRLQVID
ncbi:protein C19orf12 homolog [Calliphora vicina]|uniref:protein C19orf12 homolog n=1 Tax=Calliphora vicina TaxID=7373 RepID=UPI00325BBC6E